MARPCWHRALMAMWACFEPGDAAGLAALLARCKAEDAAAPGALMRQLQAQCAARAALFAPEAEQAALLKLLGDLLPP